MDIAHVVVEMYYCGWWWKYIMWLIVEILIVIGCEHYIFISYSFMKHWYHCGNIWETLAIPFNKNIVTLYKTLSKGCTGKEIWDIWIVYGLRNPPWVLHWEACLRRCIWGWCNNPGGCAMTSCIIIIIIYIALTLLCYVVLYCHIDLSSIYLLYLPFLLFDDLVYACSPCSSYKWYNTYFYSILVWCCNIYEIY